MTRPLPYPLRAALMLTLAASVGLAACGKKEAAADKAAAPADPAPTAPAAERPKDREITITTLKPDGETLKTGETVKMVIGADYQLPPGGGSVGIVVQDSKNTPIANRLVPVTAESGSITEQIEFKVPATDRIVVHVPLYAKGDTKSSTVATRRFDVKAK